MHKSSNLAVIAVTFCQNEFKWQAARPRPGNAPKFFRTPEEIALAKTVEGSSLPAWLMAEKADVSPGR